MTDLKTSWSWRRNDLLILERPDEAEEGVVALAAGIQKSLRVVGRIAGRSNRPGRMASPSGRTKPWRLNDQVARFARRSAKRRRSCSAGCGSFASLVRERREELAGLAPWLEAAAPMPLNGKDNRDRGRPLAIICVCWLTQPFSVASLHARAESLQADLAALAEAWPDAEGRSQLTPLGRGGRSNPPQPIFTAAGVLLPRGPKRSAIKWISRFSIARIAICSRWVITFRPAGSTVRITTFWPPNRA